MKLPVARFFFALALAAFGIATAGIGPAYAEGAIQLHCEGRDRGLTGPVGYFRLEVDVEDRELEGRHLSLNRFRDGFEAAEPLYIFEPVTRLGEVRLRYCTEPGWPSICINQQPSVRQLLVSGFSAEGGEIFLSGYTACPFCPVASLQIAPEEGGGMGFRMFEFDLVEGECAPL